MSQVKRSQYMAVSVLIGLVAGLSGSYYLDHPVVRPLLVLISLVCSFIFLANLYASIEERFNLRDEDE